MKKARCRRAERILEGEKGDVIKGIVSETRPKATATPRVTIFFDFKGSADQAAYAMPVVSF